MITTIAFTILALLIFGYCFYMLYVTIYSFDSEHYSNISARMQKLRTKLIIAYAILACIIIVAMPKIIKFTYGL